MTGNVRHIVFGCLLSLLTLTGSAQLFHFSQFNNSPVFMNPAETGFFTGTYRLSTTYRNQWSSVASPYRSFYASADGRTALGERGTSFLGLGVNFLSDKAGKTQYGISMFSGSASYMVRVAEGQGVSFGLSVGYMQQSMNLQGVRWDSQYNGATYDPNASSGEPAYAPTRNYVDVAGGAVYLYQPYRRLKMEGGLSFSHINQPKRSFIKSKDFVEGTRYTLYGRATIGAVTAIQPSFMVSKQKGSYEILVGAMEKVTIGESSRYTNALTSSAIYFGVHYRYRDGIIPQVMYEHKGQVKGAVSYDINISKLRPASRMRGGFELSLIYTPKMKDGKINVNNLKKLESSE